MTRRSLLARQAIARARLGDAIRRWAALTAGTGPDGWQASIPCVDRDGNPVEALVRIDLIPDPAEEAPHAPR